MTTTTILKTRARGALLLALTLALGACHDDAAAPDSTATPALVTFGTDVVPQDTRAVTTGPIADLDALKQLLEGFGVFAYLTDDKLWGAAGANTTPDFMYNQPVTWNSATRLWEYKPPKYWPNSSQNATPRRISFFAYAPYVDADELQATNVTQVLDAALPLPRLGYTLASVDNQVDLLWASCPNATRNGQGLIVLNDDDTRTYQTVPLQFHHALACVDIYVQRIYDEGDYSGKEPTGGEQQTKLFVGGLQLGADPELWRSGTLSLLDGSWESDATEATRNFAETVLDEHVSGTARDVAEDPTTLAYIRERELRKWSMEGYGVDGQERRLTTSPLMFFPQEVTLTPTVTYAMVTRDNSLALSTLTDASGNKYSRLLHESQGNAAKINLQAGKRYKLVLHIGTEHISFEVAGVEDWDFPLRFSTVVTPYIDTSDNRTLDEPETD